MMVCIDIVSVCGSVYVWECVYKGVCIQYVCVGAGEGIVDVYSGMYVLRCSYNRRKHGWVRKGCT